MNILFPKPDSGFGAKCILRSTILACAFLILFGLFFIKIEEIKAYGECSQYGIMAMYDILTNSCKCMSGYVFGKDLFGQTTCVSGDIACHDKYGIYSRYNSLNSSCECSYGYMFDEDFMGRMKCVSGDSVCVDEYGFGAEYDNLSGKCKCRYGYIFGKDISGNTKCISNNKYCEDKYGYNSTYNSLSGSCECLSGYALDKDSLGRIQCVSQDSICQSTYGLNSKYNSLTDKCECKSGYEMTLKNSSGLECVLCFSKYGLHSSYNYLSKKCECDSGYTLNDDNQCVKKQNNVYFILEEIDTDNKKAIIKSEYDFRYYLISYGVGCYASSIRRYLNNRIVVNLGTDFNVDMWDKIVLQNDNEFCDITRVERAYSDTTLKPKENTNIYQNFIPPTSPPAKTESQNNPVSTPITQIVNQQSSPSPKPLNLKPVDKENKPIIAISSVAELIQASGTSEVTLNKAADAKEQKTEPIVKKQKLSLFASVSNFFTKISKWVIGIFKK
ncbi:hypothetical protein KJ853_03835 [Patescibacteria group bacterium]|nr:hypothetical protein [Patescibacteria group bacterium]